MLGPSHTVFIDSILRYFFRGTAHATLGPGAPGRASGLVRGRDRLRFASGATGDGPAALTRRAADVNLYPPDGPSIRAQHSSR